MTEITLSGYQPGGVIPASQLGLGLLTGLNFLRDDGTWQVPSGGTGSFSVTEAEVDFGSTPLPELSFLITDVNVTATSKIIGGIAYVAPTGRDLDEVEMEPFNLRFGPGNGQLTIWAQAMEGPVTGKYKCWYGVG